MAGILKRALGALRKRGVPSVAFFRIVAFRAVPIGIPLRKLLWRTLLGLLVFLAPLVRAADDWPEFRGPTGQGLSPALGLPLTWSETNNIKWKTPIHGRAWSSPVVLGAQVWMATATEDGRELFAVCVDRESGKIIHDLKLFEVANPQFAHKFNTYASPTPALEPGRVYVTFGSPGTACLDTRTGKVIWERRDFECNHYRGAGSSPLIAGQWLILHFDGSDHQFLVALDKATGKTAWRKERSIDFQDLDAEGKPQIEGDLRKAFATPQNLVLTGKPTLISLGAKAAYGYDLATGHELWRVEDRTSHSAATRPVTGHGLVFYATGFPKGQLLAVRINDSGLAQHPVIDANIPSGPGTNQLQVAWSVKRNVPCKPSILLIGDLLFMIDDGGIASCLEARTGAEVWRERVGGNYSASPVSAEGRIYFCSEEGKTTVLEAGRQFKVLAENNLEDGFMASPAMAGRSLFLRTKTHLYRVEE
ncbi:MAG: PQQ-binding-like beta-propeller repeat protein [Chloroflexi bacterium]|nr:PQQ-binding-like beta-propeller repeat protein [Chloroflexota bacterium]